MLCYVNEATLDHTLITLVVFIVSVHSAFITLSITSGCAVLKCTRCRYHWSLYIVTCYLPKDQEFIFTFIYIPTLHTPLTLHTYVCVFDLLLILTLMS